VKAVVLEMREGESKTRDEMREMRDEVNNIREMLPKVSRLILSLLRTCLTFVQMINKNNDSQNQSLIELHQELKSLKALLLSRGSTMPSTPVPTVGPSIPAWQLANSHSTTPSLVPLPLFNGKSDTELDDASP